MIERQTFGGGVGANGMLSLSDDEFFRQGDEEFFKGNGPTFKDSPGEKSTQPRQEEMDIFGSRSGSKSKNQSRGLGGNYGGTNESETLGSATVKILRPPSEAGGASEPKLERAPKLDNKAVLDLIQAGFSEGTILRKIENSQVDFDLSPKALSELRKNRVSEGRSSKRWTEAMGVERNKRRAEPAQSSNLSFELAQGFLNIPFLLSMQQYRKEKMCLRFLAVVFQFVLLGAPLFAQTRRQSCTGQAAPTRIRSCFDHLD
jgi:hypothetical protein